MSFLTRTRIICAIAGSVAALNPILSLGIASSQPVVVDVSQPGTFAREMAVMMDPYGRATMLWAIQGSDPTRPLQARYESNGWQDWVDINSPGSNWDPRLAQNGEVSTAVWLSHVDGAYRVYGARSIAGYWSQSQLLGTSPFWPAPSVAVDGQGCAITVWTVEHGIKSRRFCDGGWGPETSLTEEDGSLSPQVAASANADLGAIAVWEQRHGSDYSIAFARYESAHWSAPVILHRSDTLVTRPQVVLDDQGNAVVAWEASTNGTRLIEARELRDGVWLPTVDISSSQATASKVQLSIDKAGNVMAVWGAQDGEDLLIQGSLLNQAQWSSSVTLGVAGRADTWGERGLPAPKIASMGEGQFAAIWPSWNNAETTGSVITASFGAGLWGAGEPLIATRSYPQVAIAAQPYGQIIYGWNNAGVIQSLSRGINTHLLTVKRSGEGRITSEPAGVDCGSDCATSFAPGTTVILTAQPDSGQRFGGWTGNCASRTDTTCMVVMNDAQHVGAVFRPVSALTRSVVLKMNGLGSGRVESDPIGLECSNARDDANACHEADAIFEVGKRTQLAATPSGDSYFSGWQGVCADQKATCTFTLRQGKAPVKVVANFKPNPVLHVEVNAPVSGTVRSTDGSIDCGFVCIASQGHKKRIVLQAEPAPGVRFIGWSGACSGKRRACQVDMLRNRTVKARFNR